MKTINHFPVTLDKDRTLSALGCRSSDSVYDQVSLSFDEGVEKFFALISPKAVYSMEKADASFYFLRGYSQIIYVLYTLGAGISGEISRCFAQGDYLDGMLLDTMADVYLFQMQEWLHDHLAEICRDIGLNISACFTPLDDLEPSWQKVIVDKLPIGVNLTSAYMLRPEKSGSFILGAGKHLPSCEGRHHCESCPRVVCAFRRLSDPSEKQKDYAVVSDYREPAGKPQEKAAASKPEGAALAVDIGTTTVALELVDLSVGQKIAHKSFTNPQRIYGADVMSRIQAAEDGRREKLHEMIVSALLQGIESLLKEAVLPSSSLRKIAICGNTAMTHLLLNLPVDNLGRYPFSPVFLDYAVYPFAQVFHSGSADCPVHVLPGISAFVGGDIVSGLYFCGHPPNTLFLDLGTNGEMALIHTPENAGVPRILVTSTAAGPAFEGGNLSCGIGCIPGAVYTVSDDFQYKTIKEVKPAGLCGSGVLDLAACFIRHKIIDETGLFIEPYFENGFLLGGESALRFTQKDVRELQMAKSAVRAGLETLLQKAGLSYDDVQKVYLAGGFGFKLNRASAAEIGLIPRDLLPKIEALGNSALGGAVKFLLEDKGEKRMEEIVSQAVEINLAEQKSFQDLFLDYMSFL